MRIVADQKSNLSNDFSIGSMSTAKKLSAAEWPRCDIFSVGVIAGEVFCCASPYEEQREAVGESALIREFAEHPAKPHEIWRKNTNYNQSRQRYCKFCIGVLDKRCSTATNFSRSWCRFAYNDEVS